MRAVVRERFYDFSEPMEGAVPWMYQDVKGLVSIGVGILIDPIGLAMGLPFLRSDGYPASRAEITEEWHRIKALPPNAKGQTAAQLGHLYAHPHTKLRLSREGLRSTLENKAAGFDAHLAKTYPGYEDWPADAQLATMSMAWACGPGFGQVPPPSGFPKLSRALKDWDFRIAAVECFMPEERTISGLRPRNRVNRMLYINAAIVMEQKLDPTVLHWPVDLEKVPVVPSKVRDDQLEPEPAIVHKHDYPTGYAPEDDEDPDLPPAA